MKKNTNYHFHKKAFTLVELLIVIAIIGILFIVLVSRLTFATNKASESGVQTDFRSFQVALETVARENAGFNTLGWDTGDKKRHDFDEIFPGYTYTNEEKDAGDRHRNNYDVGDLNLNDICDSDETWTGKRICTEEWTGLYTLDNPGDPTDYSAYLLLEQTINKWLNDKLHLTIDVNTKQFFMKNHFKDPWGTEYHGFYITNALNDQLDRGAIVIYSNGENKIFGSTQRVEGGKTKIYVPQGNVKGRDDLAIVVMYSYYNSYGEVLTSTHGFSQNQDMNVGNQGNNQGWTPDAPPPDHNYDDIEPGLYQTGSNYEIKLYSWQEMVDMGWINSMGIVANEHKDKIAGDIAFSRTLFRIYQGSFSGCTNLTGFYIPDNVTKVEKAFENTPNLGHVQMSHIQLELEESFRGSGLRSVTLTNKLVRIPDRVFAQCTNLKSIEIPEGIEYLGMSLFEGCTSLESVKIPSTLKGIGDAIFGGCTVLNNINLPDAVTIIPQSAFCCCTSLTNLTYGELSQIGNSAFHRVPMTNFVASDKLMVIGEFAFALTKLQNVDLSQSDIYAIPTSAFFECDDLTNIILPDICTTIGSQAFYKTGLTSITISKNITAINSGAFEESVSLNTINYLGTVSEWNSIAKDHTFMQGISSWNVICTDGKIDENGNVTYN